MHMLSQFAKIIRNQTQLWIFLTDDNMLNEADTRDINPPQRFVYQISNSL